LTEFVDKLWKLDIYNKLFINNNYTGAYSRGQVTGIRVRVYTII